MRDAILDAEVDALRAIAAGRTPTKSPLGPMLGPDIRRKYGEYLTGSDLGDGAFIHGQRGPSQ